MNRIKRILTIVTAAALLTAGANTAMAADYKNPAEITAALTGRTTEDIINERNTTGKSYGTIAREAGKLEEFKNACLSLSKTALDEDVANGRITQAEADEIYAAIQSHQTVCNGLGYGGHGYGVCYGYGRGSGTWYGHHGAGNHHGAHRW